MVVVVGVTVVIAGLLKDIYHLVSSSKLFDKQFQAPLRPSLMQKCAHSTARSSRDALVYSCS